LQLIKQYFIRTGGRERRKEEKEGGREGVRI
jgi:hypothetical protein